MISVDVFTVLGGQGSFFAAQKYSFILLYRLTTVFIYADLKKIFLFSLLRNPVLKGSQKRQHLCLLLVHLL